jgi:hypothetical protein
MVMSCNHRFYVHGHPYLPDQLVRPEFTYAYLVINAYKFQYLSKGYAPTAQFYDCRSYKRHYQGCNYFLVVIPPRTLSSKPLCRAYAFEATPS